jgi:hypothetical protein
MSRWTCALAALLMGAAASASPAGEAVCIRVVEDHPDAITLVCHLRAFTREIVRIDGRPFLELDLPGEGLLKQVGAPALPAVARSVIIPDSASVAVRVTDAAFYEIDDIDIGPSRGFVVRSVDLASVPHIFGRPYQTDAFFPAALATLGDPYILRDHRGVVVSLHPFQYNPVRRVLRVYTEMMVEIAATGDGRMNRLEHRPRVLSRAFHQLYERHFINYRLDGRYPPLDEEGGMLIICHDPWIDDVMPLVEHKNSVGIATTIVGVSEIGNDANLIRAYIQAVYDSTDLAFVLLVGDVAQVATPYVAFGPADPVYAKVAGADDYPDIMVGRFSAATPQDVQTQVQRSIEYENMPATEQDWFWRGTGVSSDGAYMDTVRQKLLDHGYTEVDQIYDPDATPQMVIDALNAGRGIVNYYGHASAVNWYTGSFGIEHIGMLTNEGMLPFVLTVACSNGAFHLEECMAEAWLRAQHGGAPTGAIACYAASGYQYWDGPTSAHQETIDLYLDGEYHSFGTLCFAGGCKMIDEYGPEGVSMFDTWIVFGDPSLRIVGSVEHACPADFDDDGDVDTADLLYLLGCWGDDCGDVDGDADTDTADLLALLAAWGQCP